jgi:hypothetical protein
MLKTNRTVLERDAVGLITAVFRRKMALNKKKTALTGEKVVLTMDEQQNEGSVARRRAEFFVDSKVLAAVHKFRDSRLYVAHLLIVSFVLSPFSHTHTYIIHTSSSSLPHMSLSPPDHLPYLFINIYPVFPLFFTAPSMRRAAS